MTILIYRGSFQYGVVDFFIDEVKKELELKKHKVIELDLANPNASQEIIPLFSNNVIELVIGFGGIGSSVKVNGDQSIYDAVNSTYVGIYIDHPAHLLTRIIEPIKNHLVCFVDKSHVDYVNEILPQNHKLNFFLPHGGMSLGNEQIQTLEQFNEKKDIDILFAGTFMGEPNKPWESIENFPSRILNDICYLLIQNDDISVHKAFDMVFEKEKVVFSTISKAQMAAMIVNVITYIRQYQRKVLIEKLLQSGMKITICGKNWEGFLSKYDSVDYKGELNIKDTLELVSKAKIVVNASPNFNQGSHERVFTAMLNNAVVFSDKSSYYDEFYEDGKNILYYSMKTLDQDIEKLKSLTNEKLFEISNSAYSITQGNHLWKNRVEKLLEMVTLSKVMDN